MKDLVPWMPKLTPGPGGRHIVGRLRLADNAFLSSGDGEPRVCRPKERLFTPLSPSYLGVAKAGRLGEGTQSGKEPEGSDSALLRTDIGP